MISCIIFDMSIPATKNKENKIKEILKQHFEDEIRSDVGLCSYLIFPDGTLIGGYRHRDFLDYLIDEGVLTEDEIHRWDTDIFNEVFDCVRATDIGDHENYIGLPDKELTELQYDVLGLFLDNNLNIGRKVMQVTTGYGTDNQNNIMYNYKDIMGRGEFPTDYIIDKIKRYYNTGKLEEDIELSSPANLTPESEWRWSDEYKAWKTDIATMEIIRDLKQEVLGDRYEFEGGSYLNNCIERCLTEQTWYKGPYLLELFTMDDCLEYRLNFGGACCTLCILPVAWGKTGVEYNFATSLEKTLDLQGYTDEFFEKNKDKVEEKLQEKIVKKGSKWQVQSEKGRNLGTYDTKAEAEKRLQQVHYFKHMGEDVEKEIKVRDNPNIEKDAEECPLPLHIIPNNIGINLCNVDKIEWEEQDDGQLKEIEIKFNPNNNLKEDIYLDDLDDIEKPTKRGEYSIGSSNIVDYNIKDNRFIYAIAEIVSKYKEITGCFGEEIVKRFEQPNGSGNCYIDIETNKNGSLEYSLTIDGLVFPLIQLIRRKSYGKRSKQLFDFAKELDKFCGFNYATEWIKSNTLEEDVNLEPIDFDVTKVRKPTRSSGWNGTIQGYNTVYGKYSFYQLGDSTIPVAVEEAAGMNIKYRNYYDISYWFKHYQKNPDKYRWYIIKDDYSGDYYLNVLNNLDSNYWGWMYPDKMIKLRQSFAKTLLRNLKEDLNINTVEMHPEVIEKTNSYDKYKLSETELFALLNVVNGISNNINVEFITSMVDSCNTYGVLMIFHMEKNELYYALVAPGTRINQTLCFYVAHTTPEINEEALEIVKAIDDLFGWNYASSYLNEDLEFIDVEVETPESKIPNGYAEFTKEMYDKIKGLGEGTVKFKENWYGKDKIRADCRLFIMNVDSVLKQWSEDLFNSDTYKLLMKIGDRGMWSDLYIASKYKINTSKTQGIGWRPRFGEYIGSIPSNIFICEVLESIDEDLEMATNKLPNWDLDLYIPAFVDTSGKFSWESYVSNPEEDITDEESEKLYRDVINFIEEHRNEKVWSVATSYENAPNQTFDEAFWDFLNYEFKPDDDYYQVHLWYDNNDSILARFAGEIIELSNGERIGPGYNPGLQFDEDLDIQEVEYDDSWKQYHYYDGSDMWDDAAVPIYKAEDIIINNGSDYCWYLELSDGTTGRTYSGCIYEFDSISLNGYMTFNEAYKKFKDFKFTSKHQTLYVCCVISDGEFDTGGYRYHKYIILVRYSNDDLKEDIAFVDSVEPPTVYKDDYWKVYNPKSDTELISVWGDVVGYNKWARINISIEDYDEIDKHLYIFKELNTDRLYSYNSKDKTFVFSDKENPQIKTIADLEDLLRKSEHTENLISWAAKRWPAELSSIRADLEAEKLGIVDGAIVYRSESWDKLFNLKGSRLHQVYDSLCSKITTLIVPNNIKFIRDEFDYYSAGHIYNLYNLTKVVIQGNNLRTIGESVFSSSDLEEINLPDSLQHIGKAAFNYASLTKIFIPIGCTRIDGLAFCGNKGIKIYCEAPEKPEGWAENWCDRQAIVYWGCTRDSMSESNKTNEDLEFNTISNSPIQLYGEEIKLEDIPDKLYDGKNIYIDTDGTIVCGNGDRGILSNVSDDDLNSLLEYMDHCCVEMSYYEIPVQRTEDADLICRIIIGSPNNGLTNAQVDILNTIYNTYPEFKYYETTIKGRTGAVLDFPFEIANINEDIELTDIKDNTKKIAGTNTLDGIYKIGNTNKVNFIEAVRNLPISIAGGQLVWDMSKSSVDIDLDDPSITCGKILDEYFTAIWLYVPSEIDENAAPVFKSFKNRLLLMLHGRLHGVLVFNPVKELADILIKDSEEAIYKKPDDEQ